MSSYLSCDHRLDLPPPPRVDGGPAPSRRGLPLGPLVGGLVHWSLTTTQSIMCSMILDISGNELKYFSAWSFSLFRSHIKEPMDFLWTKFNESCTIRDSREHAMSANIMGKNERRFTYLPINSYLLLNLALFCYFMSSFCCLLASCCSHARGSAGKGAIDFQCTQWRDDCDVACCMLHADWQETHLWCRKQFLEISWIKPYWDFLFILKYWLIHEMFHCVFTDVYGITQNGWYILCNHSPPIQNFITMHDFIVNNVQRKKTAAELALGAECQIHQTFRFDPCALF